MISFPKPMDQIQPNLVFELLACMGRTTAKYFWPRGQKLNSPLPLVMVSPPKPLGQIQPNLVCELHEWGMQRNFFPRPLGWGQKVKYHLISITKSISKVFIPNFFVFLQIKDMKHIEWDFRSDT